MSVLNRVLPWRNSNSVADKVTVTLGGITALLLLSKFGGEIEGKHRMQKLVFLTDHAFDEYDLYDYRKYDYGPYSGTLNADISRLERVDLLRVDVTRTFGGNKRYTYKSTEVGEGALQELVQEQPRLRVLDQEVEEIVEAHGEKSLPRILDAVHADHPQYWENSVYRTRR